MSNIVIVNHSSDVTLCNIGEIEPVGVILYKTSPKDSVCFIQYYSILPILHQLISILHNITNIAVNLYHLDDVILAVLCSICRIE